MPLKPKHGEFKGQYLYAKICEYKKVKYKMQNTIAWYMMDKCTKI